MNTEEFIYTPSTKDIFLSDNRVEKDLAEAQELFGELFKQYKNKIYEASTILEQNKVFLQAKGKKAYFTQEARNKICFLYAQKNEEEGMQFLQEIYANIQEKNELYKSVFIQTKNEH